jgi:hypothetical protein
MIELLIAIGVILILATLLLGAINHVKVLSIRTQCASNVRQVGTALHQYSTRNTTLMTQDSLPLGAPSAGSASTIPQNVVWDTSLPGAGPTEKYIGAGLLIRDKLITTRNDPPESAEILNCPAYDITRDAGLDGSQGLNVWKNGWPNSLPVRYQTPYMYRASYNFGSQLQPLGRQLRIANNATDTTDPGKMTLNLAVYADIFTDQQALNAHGNGYTVLYLDNSYKWFDDPITDTAAGPPTAGAFIRANIGAVDWANVEGTGTTPTTGWRYFDTNRR